MEKRKLGNADLSLTTIGLGTWAIGGPWQWGWGPQDDRESIATIHRALDLGINWIDTAPAYGLGRSETVVGQAIRGRRDGLIIATKCGRVWDDPSSGRIYSRLKGDSVRREAEASLRRLGVDVIDLYQIHWPLPDEDIEEAWEAIARLVDEGKIRYAGVSNFSAEQIHRVHAIHPVASLQAPYSMLRRDIEATLLGFCAANGIGVVTYSPMQAGLLTGKFSEAYVAGLPADDWRRENPMFNEPQLSANLALVEGLRPLAAGQGRSLAELAIAWVLRRREVSSAIVGARQPWQIQETVPSAGWTLTTDEQTRIERLLQQRSTALGQ